MSGYIRLTLLGTGSSGGVPRSNGDWGACDPTEPRNERRRCSALIERACDRDTLEAGAAVTRLVIDTSPDFRAQMLAARVRHIDGVALTHDHADQTHGIDDVRAFAYFQEQRVPVWMDAATRATMMQRFGYVFETPSGSAYPPILEAMEMPAPGDAFRVTGPGGAIDITPIAQQHGRIPSLGFRVGGLAYSPDISGLPDSSLPHMSGLACWVVDALREEPHPTHFAVRDAIEAVRRVGAKAAVLTNMHNTLDYASLKRRLPDGFRPGHDGLQIDWDGTTARIDPN
ncbi:MBL fold metallo-hydrolase [Maricaulis sp. CAU 1757]